MKRFIPRGNRPMTPERHRQPLTPESGHAARAAQARFDAMSDPEFADVLGSMAATLRGRGADDPALFLEESARRLRRAAKDGPAQTI